MIAFWIYFQDTSTFTIGNSCLCPGRDTIEENQIQLSNNAEIRLEFA